MRLYSYIFISVWQFSILLVVYTYCEEKKFKSFNIVWFSCEKKKEKRIAFEKAAQVSASAAVDRVWACGEAARQKSKWNISLILWTMTHCIIQSGNRNSNGDESCTTGSFEKGGEEMTHELLKAHFLHYEANLAERGRIVKFNNSERNYSYERKYE